MPVVSGDIPPRRNFFVALMHECRVIYKKGTAQDAAERRNLSELFNLSSSLAMLTTHR